MHPVSLPLLVKVESFISQFCLAAKYSAPILHSNVTKFCASISFPQCYIGSIVSFPCTDCFTIVKLGTAKSSSIYYIVDNTRIFYSVILKARRPTQNVLSHCKEEVVALTSEHAPVFLFVHTSMPNNLWLEFSRLGMQHCAAFQCLSVVCCQCG